MKIEHVALGYNSEEESDRFFVDLLGLKKVRIKSVSKDLMEKFFGIDKEHKFVEYADDNSKFEIFITDDRSNANDVFTHACLLIENRNEFLNKASSMGFECIKVPRQEGNEYYLFVKDSYQNLYEIKEND